MKPPSESLGNIQVSILCTTQSPWRHNDYVLYEMRNYKAEHTKTLQKFTQDFPHCAVPNCFYNDQTKRRKWMVWYLFFKPCDLSGMQAFWNPTWQLNGSCVTVVVHKELNGNILQYTWWVADVWRTQYDCDGIFIYSAFFSTFFILNISLVTPLLYLHLVDWKVSWFNGVAHKMFSV